MLYTIPDYYKEFACTADQCEDTCCAGWQIVIDDRSLEKYRKVQGTFKRRLRKAVNWKEQVFRQSTDKRCAFLNENNLCDMYTALGSKSLCRTCRLYPRHIEEFEGIREISLSISCPEVAKILLSKTEPVKFVSYEKDGDDDYEDFDFLLYSQLLDAREVMIHILQDRSKSVKLRAGLMLAIAHDMQGRINRGELFTCNEVLEKYQKDEALEFVCAKIAEWEDDILDRFLFAKKAFANLHRLELLKEDWFVALRETQELIYPDEKKYQTLCEEFTAWMDENLLQWEIQKEQILVYFIFTYFCGAVYDGRVYAKAQMAAASVFYIEQMLMARWLKNEKMLDQEDILNIVYRYSREVEHSDINLERLEKIMEKEVWLCTTKS